MGRIKLLEDNVVNMIAAGEVVERPASVVKELIENSLDAGAINITLKVTGNGAESITITDDGAGMDAEDAQMAFKQHATSKISSAEDLQYIHTFGFRGEALASVSSVAEITLETKTAGSSAVKLHVYKGDSDSLASARTTTGTTITISNLFGDTPARRKFLRTEATEVGYIQDVFLSLALVNLSVHFEMYHNGKLTYRLPAASNFQERVHSIWEGRVAENLYSFSTEYNGSKLDVFAGKPDIARKDRKLQFVFVNGRHINDRLIQKAVTEGYQGFIHKDIQPVYFLFLTTSPELVDVNVHPRKQEVRFREPGQIYSLVSSSIKQVLQKSTKEDLLSRIEGVRHTESLPQIPSIPYTHVSSKEPKAYIAPRTKQSIPQSLSFTAELLTQTEPHSLSDNAPATYPTAEKPRVLQVFSTYIVYQHDDHIIFIDQHAAAEKILYEKLLDQMDTNRSKPLLIAEVIEVQRSEKEKILSLETRLHHVGFEISDFGGNAVQINAIPEILNRVDFLKFIQEVITLNLDTDETDQLVTNERDKNMVVATLACHSAVRAGQVLSVPEMTQIISDLGKCQNPYNCPHGRPVSWIMPQSQLEKEFKRTL